MVASALIWAFFSCLMRLPPSPPEILPPSQQSETPASAYRLALRPDPAGMPHIRPLQISRVPNLTLYSSRSDPQVRRVQAAHVGKEVVFR